jgi:hypothetical protein
MSTFFRAATFYEIGREVKDGNAKMERWLRDPR